MEGKLRGWTKLGLKLTPLPPSVHEMRTCEMCDSEYAASP